MHCKQPLYFHFPAFSGYAKWKPLHRDGLPPDLSLARNSSRLASFLDEERGPWCSLGEWPLESEAFLERRLSWVGLSLSTSSSSYVNDKIPHLKKKAPRPCAFKGQISPRMFKLVYSQRREYLIGYLISWRRWASATHMCTQPGITLVHTPEEAAWVVIRIHPFATSTLCQERVLGEDPPCWFVPLNYSASCSTWGTHGLRRKPMWCWRRIQCVKCHFQSISLGSESTFYCFLIHRI